MIRRATCPICSSASASTGGCRTSRIEGHRILRRRAHRPLRSAAGRGPAPPRDRHHQGALPAGECREDRRRPEGRAHRLPRQPLRQPGGPAALDRGRRLARARPARSKDRHRAGLGKWRETAERRRHGAHPARPAGGGRREGGGLRCYISRMVANLLVACTGACLFAAFSMDPAVEDDSRILLSCAGTLVTAGQPAAGSRIETDAAVDLDRGSVSGFGLGRVPIVYVTQSMIGFTSRRWKARSTAAPATRPWPSTERTPGPRSCRWT